MKLTGNRHESLLYCDKLEPAVYRLCCCEFVAGMFSFVWVAAQQEVKRLQIGAQHPCVKSASHIRLESFERLHRQDLLCLNSLLEVIMCQDFTDQVNVLKYYDMSATHDQIPLPISFKCSQIYDCSDSSKQCTSSFFVFIPGAGPLQRFLAFSSWRALQHLSMNHYPCQHLT